MKTTTMTTARVCEMDEQVCSQQSHYLLSGKRHSIDSFDVTVLLTHHYCCYRYFHLCVTYFLIVFPRLIQIAIVKMIARLGKIGTCLIVCVWVKISFSLISMIDLNYNEAKIDDRECIREFRINFCDDANICIRYTIQCYSGLVLCLCLKKKNSQYFYDKTQPW